MTGSVNGLNFSNKFSQLGEAFFTRLEPTGFANPFLVNFNPNAAVLVKLDKLEIDYFCGNKLFSGGDYLASVYSGHQFGHYVPQLGDGRAIMIGEVNSLSLRERAGKRVSKSQFTSSNPPPNLLPEGGGEFTSWEMQLKGSGKTPYSRFGDGRAVLRSCIREYLCSEAMHNLGIPTTRALCVVGSDEDVQRETVEKAAMMTRLSPSHIRFGHFEYFYYTGQHKQLRELADFTINNYYSGCDYESFFEQVVLRTAALIAKWQAVGFAHGVMNTDNMSILGLTIDYGPFGFMEEYEPGYICNHSDHSGRYAFDQQPYIGLWNLHALAMSLTPLVTTERAGEILQKYQPEFVKEYERLMFRKLGLENGDKNLLGELLALLEKNRPDYTNFFRKLANGEEMRGFEDWYAKYSKCAPDRGVMLTSNPKYILRNYLAENAIKTAQNANFIHLTNLLNLLKTPYEEQPENEVFAQNSPEWAKDLEVSCSS